MKKFYIFLNLILYKKVHSSHSVSVAFWSMCFGRCVLILKSPRAPWSWLVLIAEQIARTFFHQSVRQHGLRKGNVGTKLGSRGVVSAVSDIEKYNCQVELIILAAQQRHERKEHSWRGRVVMACQESNICEFHHRKKWTRGLKHTEQSKRLEPKWPHLLVFCIRKTNGLHQIFAQSSLTRSTFLEIWCLRFLFRHNCESNCGSKPRNILQHNTFRRATCCQANKPRRSRSSAAHTECQTKTRHRENETLMTDSWPVWSSGEMICNLPSRISARPPIKQSMSDLHSQLDAHQAFSPQKLFSYLCE